MSYSRRWDIVPVISHKGIQALFAASIDEFIRSEQSDFEALVCELFHETERIQLRQVRQRSDRRVLFLPAINDAPDAAVGVVARGVGER
ncbi:MAG: hypothetical protein WCF18_00690, partial [Chthoniobacteraceae bacterium]